MTSYTLNVVMLFMVSITSLMCSCYMCYANVVSSEYDSRMTILSILGACCSLYGMCIAMILDREDNALSLINMHMDKLPSYNKRILTRSRSLDAFDP